MMAGAIGNLNRWTEENRRTGFFWQQDKRPCIRPYNEPWQSYNLTENLSESHDLSGMCPERVKELRATLTAWNDTL